MNFEDIKIGEDVTFYERPVKVLGHGTKKLKNKEIPLVKVQWSHHDKGNASWELELEMWEKFPELFTD